MNRHLTIAETPWQSVWPPPQIQAGQVHLWRVPFVSLAEPLAKASFLLQAEELDWIKKALFPKTQVERLTGRAAIRLLAAQYLGIPPGVVSLGTNAYGKPFLANQSTPLFFNLSHAGSYCLLAWTKNAPIGVDIEAVDEEIDLKAVGKIVFSDNELKQLSTLDNDEYLQAFFRLWTRKEAFIKAKGQGLSFPLKSLSISHGLAATKVLGTDWDEKEANTWLLHSFEVAANLPAAMAIQAAVNEISYFEFEVAALLSKD